MNANQISAQDGQGWSARRIKRLADGLNAQHYIEVGVNNGATFHQVEIPHKTAVDPKFLFDIENFLGKNIEYFEIISDEYFKMVDKKKKFDLYFLDGLHTFEQTLRDFCNSLTHCHSRTVWLIDDTKPTDIFSSLRDQNRTIKFRHMTGNMSKDWHGDVFKLVYYIHDFMPSLNYRTLTGSGNSQTLVWRSNHGWRTPRFDNLETIARMTFFDMHDNLDVLRECPEDEAIQLCLDEVSNTSQPSEI